MRGCDQVRIQLTTRLPFPSIGDTHGQFFDFYHLLSLTGRPSPTHTLLFNGDFVDRGSWSTEIVLVLFAYKCECDNEQISLRHDCGSETDLNVFVRFKQGCTRTKSS